MSDCPQPNDLIAVAPNDLVRAHLAECEACRGLARLAAPAVDDEECDRALAHIAAGTGQQMVRAHLSRCSSCALVFLELVDEPAADARRSAVAVETTAPHRGGRRWIYAGVAIAAAAAAIVMFALRPDDAAPTDRRITTESRRSGPATPVRLPDLDVVVLVQGDVPWMGNDGAVPPDDPDYMPGALGPAGQALERLGAALPARARVAVFTLGGIEPRLRQGFGPARTLSASILGPADEERPIAVPLVLGLDTALDTFPADGGHHVLIVVGDGTDLMEFPGSRLDQPVARLRAAGVDTYAVRCATVPWKTPALREIGYTRYYDLASCAELPAVFEQIGRRVR